MKIFRLFLRIDSRLEQIVRLLVLLEKHHQESVSPAKRLWLNNQDVMQKVAYQRKNSSPPTHEWNLKMHTH